ncbi:sulfatase [Microbacterium halotolerans]|uniref:sulfatase family protein n=1 Tax=Microbacterium halotolerans TaxID=246613 RepID=UPI000E6AC435|nr:sulfatase [Microbacterium halotolerans]
MANILFITADDMEGTTPGAFGGPSGVTPSLDGLAEEGAVFGRAHVAVAVCQPSRSAIMTGLWPHRNGAEGFEPIDDSVTLLTTLLADAGYVTGIFGKVKHLQPIERFGWDTAVDMAALGMGRDPQRYAQETAAFLADAGERPWFLMVNAHDPHRPFHGADSAGRYFDEEQAATIPAPSRVYSADDAGPVPGFLPDLPDVRREYAEYLSSSRRCDDVVRAVLGELEASGAAESTLVVFLSDNGMAFPFAKANCYLQSTHTPLIVRWPGEVRPGIRLDAPFVSSLDLFPTFCDAAGIDSGEVDGRSLLPLLREGDEPARDHIVTVFHETAGKRRYEMRCVQDDRFGYIWNGWAESGESYRAENMLGRTWPAMLEAAGSDPVMAARTDFYEHRAQEELYDLRLDPHSLENLAGESGFGGELDAKRKALAEWMRETGDPRIEAFEAMLASRNARI